MRCGCTWTTFKPTMVKWMISTFSYDSLRNSLKSRMTRYSTYSSYGLEELMYRSNTALVMDLGFYERLTGEQYRIALYNFNLDILEILESMLCPRPNRPVLCNCAESIRWCLDRNIDICHHKLCSAEQTIQTCSTS